MRRCIRLKRTRRGGRCFDGRAGPPSSVGSADAVGDCGSDGRRARSHGPSPSHSPKRSLSAHGGKEPWRSGAPINPEMLHEGLLRGVASTEAQILRGRPDVTSQAADHRLHDSRFDLGRPRIARHRTGDVAVGAPFCDALPPSSARRSSLSHHPAARRRRSNARSSVTRPAAPARVLGRYFFFARRPIRMRSVTVVLGRRLAAGLGRKRPVIASRTALLVFFFAMTQVWQTRASPAMRCRPGSGTGRAEGRQTGRGTRRV